jgi:DNA primase
VRFGAIDDFAVIGEGIETVLSLNSSFPDIPMVAALSAAHLAAWRPPSNLRRLVIAADNDEPGRSAAQRLSAQMREHLIDATTIIPLGADFNRELRKTSRESMHDRVTRLIWG